MENIATIREWASCVPLFGPLVGMYNLYTSQRELSHFFNALDSEVSSLYQTWVQSQPNGAALNDAAALNNVLHIRNTILGSRQTLRERGLKIIRQAFDYSFFGIIGNFATIVALAALVENVFKKSILESIAIGAFYLSLSLIFVHGYYVHCHKGQTLDRLGAAFQPLDKIGELQSGRAD